MHELFSETLAVPPQKTASKIMHCIYARKQRQRFEQESDDFDQSRHLVIGLSE